MLRVFGTNISTFDHFACCRSYAYRGDEAESLDAAAEADAIAARRNATGCPPVLCKVLRLFFSCHTVPASDSGLV